VNLLDINSRHNAYSCITNGLSVGLVIRNYPIQLPASVYRKHRLTAISLVSLRRQQIVIHQVSTRINGYQDGDIDLYTDQPSTAVQYLGHVTREEQHQTMNYTRRRLERSVSERHHSVCIDQGSVKLYLNSTLHCDPVSTTSPTTTTTIQYIQYYLFKAL